MNLLIFTINVVIGCSTAAPVPVNAPLHWIQQEMEQLKRSNEESIAALKRTYDEKIRIYDEKIRRNDEKIASLEQQLRWGKNLVPQSGSVSFNMYSGLSFYLISCNLFKTYWEKGLTASSREKS